MPEVYKPIDISNDPTPLKLAEEVHTTHEPRILPRDDEDLAVLMPVTPKAQTQGQEGERSGSLPLGRWQLEGRGYRQADCRHLRESAPFLPSAC
jgi:hypothetical protein